MEEQDGASASNKSKKRVSNLKKWKKTIRKVKRNSGVSYENTKKAVVPEKSEPKEVTCKCQFACKCLTLECRKELFRQFWNLGNYNEQQVYLQNLVRICLINRRRHGSYDEPAQSRRQHTYKYLLVVRGMSEVQVCKKTFCETFGVSPRRVQLLCEKKSGNDETTVKDKRGGSRPKRQVDWKKKIMDYISQIPAQESHYCRNSTPNRKYLSTDLNVTKLYKGFIDTHRNGQNVPPVSRQWFNEIFLTEFNLAFKPPRVDTCPTCDSTKIKMDCAMTEELKNQYKNELELHHRLAEAAREAMNKDSSESRKHDSDVRVVQFDLQQQMYLPTLTHTQMYYSRQLANVNMGLHLEDENRGIMCLWDETVGNRGSNEIDSCIYKMLTSNEIGCTTTKNKLILWSDNCGGQNKNQAVLAMLITLVAKGYFDEVIHKFPVKGHTFLSCDRDFAIIEKCKRRKAPLVPKDLIEIIANASQKSPFLVVRTTTFYNWMNVAKEMLNTKKLMISTATMIKVTARSFGVVEIKKRYSEMAPWHSTPCLKAGVTQDNFRNLEINFVETPVPLSNEKKKDIAAMLPYMKGDALLFYENLIR